MIGSLGVEAEKSGNLSMDKTLAGARKSIFLVWREKEERESECVR